jgi:hypothetical protein
VTACYNTTDIREINSARRNAGERAKNDHKRDCTLPIQTRCVLSSACAQ